jgi:transcriptional regulator with XRE-family HTH domain
VPTPREELASILQQARIAASYTSQADFAKAILKSRPMVTRAESSANPVPSDDVLEAWAEITGIDLGALKDLANRVRGGNPEWFVPY